MHRSRSYEVHNREVTGHAQRSICHTQCHVTAVSEPSSGSRPCASQWYSASPIQSQSASSSPRESSSTLPPPSASSTTTPPSAESCPPLARHFVCMPDEVVLRLRSATTQGFGGGGQANRAGNQSGRSTSPTMSSSPQPTSDTLRQQNGRNSDSSVASFYTVLEDDDLSINVGGNSDVEVATPDGVRDGKSVLFTVPSTSEMTSSSAPKGLSSRGAPHFVKAPAPKSGLQRKSTSLFATLRGHFSRSSRTDADAVGPKPPNPQTQRRSWVFTKGEGASQMTLGNSSTSTSWSEEGNTELDTEEASTPPCSSMKEASGASVAAVAAPRDDLKVSATGAGVSQPASSAACSNSRAGRATSDSAAVSQTDSPPAECGGEQCMRDDGLLHAGGFVAPLTGLNCTCNPDDVSDDDHDGDNVPGTANGGKDGKKRKVWLLDDGDANAASFVMRTHPEVLRRIPRSKVPRLPGCSMRDWAMLESNRRQKKGLSCCGEKQLRRITAQEVAQHNTADDLWMVIRGLVYDCTHFQRFHPGGERLLQECAGRDATAIYDAFHPWIACESMLESYVVGAIAEE